MRYALVIAIALAGCHLLGGTDDLVIVQPEVAASDTGAGGATSSTSAGTGGGASCSNAICSQNQGECQMCTCLEGIVCDCDPLAVGTMCSGGYCDGGGTCAPCLDDTEHPCMDMMLTCDNNICVPGSCTDMTPTPPETGVDCGGGTCAPCPNAQGCKVNGDCQSGLCSELVCIPCNMHSECGAMRYCENQICWPQKGGFESCSQDYECLTNNCVCTIFGCGCDPF